MSDTDFLLTEEFMAYTAKIKEIYDKKKENEKKFKKLFDAFKKEQKVLDLEAKENHTTWEKWKSEQLGKQDAEDK
jgi:phosphoribosylformimino-5-aminoimidazole carboxamide ribonucleotide (ProFAR) isomerase